MDVKTGNGLGSVQFCLFWPDKNGQMLFKSLNCIPFLYQKLRVATYITSLKNNIKKRIIFKLHVPCHQYNFSKGRNYLSLKWEKWKDGNKKKNRWNGNKLGKKNISN